MEELTIKQKAKAYDLALERAREKYAMFEGMKQGDVLEDVFPELCKPKDEKIRKVLINMFKGYNMQKVGDFTDKEIIAWLEKQGQVNETIISQHENKICKENNDSLTSEDEKIRKAIHIYLDWLDGRKNYMPRGEYTIRDMLAWLEKQGEQKPTLPIWKYKNDNTPLLRDSLILNKYGCVAKSPSGALVGDVWVIDYDELAKLPKEEIEKQDKQKSKNESTDTCDSLIIKNEFPASEKRDFGYFNKSTDKVEHLSAQKGVYYVCIKDYYSADNKTLNTKGKIYKSPCDGYINDDKGFGLSWINSCTENYFRPVKEEDWIVYEQNNVIGKPLQYKDFMGELIQKNIKLLEDKGIVLNFRLWNIADAKDGDVLAVTMYPEGTWIGIFKEQNGDTFSSHCFVNTEGSFEQGAYGHGKKGVYPATKEQRDTLIKAMADAGYTFDFEKKELKKNNSYCQENCKGFQETGKCFADGDCKAKIEAEQNSAWSDEDEKNLLDIKCLIGCYRAGDVECRLDTWIDNFKDRVQPKIKLTQLDKNILEAAIAFVEQNNHFNCWGGVDKHTVLSALHSLRTQKQWKPSDEQMKALKEACDEHWEPDGLDPLYTLYQELKKLRGK